MLILLEFGKNLKNSMVLICSRSDGAGFDDLNLGFFFLFSFMS